MSYDRLASGPVDLYVGFDLFSVGQQQAQSLVDQAPKGNYFLLGGSKLDGNSAVVRSGQMKVLQPYIDRGDIRVFADVWVPEWSATKAYMLVAKELQKLDAAPVAVVASNDAIAGGAVQALEDRGWSGKVLVSGQDADLAAIERIFDGTQLMTVYKPVGREARAAAEAAVKLAKHEEVKTSSSVAERHLHDQGDPAQAGSRQARLAERQACLRYSGECKADCVQRWISEVTAGEKLCDNLILMRPDKDQTQAKPSRYAGKPSAAYDAMEQQRGDRTIH